MKKIPLITIMLVLSLILVACNNQDDDSVKEDEKTVEKTEQNEKDSQEQNAVDKSDTAKSDDELKEEFSKEKGVNSVSLIVTEDSGGYVLVDVNVDGDMKKEAAEEIATRFMAEIEKKYPDYKIDIQARKNGSTFAQKTKE